MTIIKHIVYQPLDREYEAGRFDYFIRQPIARATLIANHGIEGDRKAGHNRRRQLNLLDVDWLAARAAAGFKTAPGEFGEQLTLAGIDLLSLPAGTRLQLGAAAVIELTGGRSPCSRLAAAQAKSIERLGPAGMLARVIQGGMIAVGDVVTVLDPTLIGAA